MKILSTNISNKRIVDFKGRKVSTGIYKTAVKTPIFLGKENVLNDFIGNKIFHGGPDKACYMYSFDHYPFWQKKYTIPLEYGMFGENLTVENFSENKIYIGAIYKIGETILQVSQPREPCFKLGIRFNNQAVVKDFLESDFPGIYFRILKEGTVKIGDKINLIENPENLISVLETYKVFSSYNKYDLMKKSEKIKTKESIKKILNSELLSKGIKKNITKILMKINSKLD